MGDQPAWLTVAEVADRLRVTPQTVQRWLRSGKLRGHNFSGRTGYRIRREDLEAFESGEQHRPRTQPKEGE